LYLGSFTGNDIQVLICMYSLQRTRYMLVGSRPFPYLVSQNKLILLSNSGKPVLLVLLGNYMQARQRSLWWLRSQFSFVGELRASWRSRSAVVHLGTIDVMSVCTVEGYIDTLFLLFSREAPPSCSGAGR
jgi:hypothetical protein